MRKEILLLLALVVGVLGIFFWKKSKGDSQSLISMSRELLTAQSEVPKSAWVWETDWIFDENSQSEIIEFCNNNNIQILFFNIEPIIIIEESSLAVNEKQIKKDEFSNFLAKFIDKANKQDIAVHALIGGEEWYKSSHAYIPLELVNYVNNFNKSNEIGFTAIQLDIEFYNDNAYKSSSVNTQKAYISEFLSLVKDVRNKSSVPIGIAIPYWFDSSSRIPLVSYGGKEALILEHILEIIDGGYVAIMSYRTEAEGDNGVLKLVEEEVSILKKYPQTKFHIGQETTDVDGNKVSYYNLNHSNFQNTSRRINKEFINDNQFSTVAVHHLFSFMDLK